ncbi:Ldh family oxidoreductase [Oceanobacillus locisalsi]|uniref:Ldh family oxidoreductase n=1 Tax=Oceanobacillus locisalsi TaxID=546107 RepID=A0ABW3NBI0_9BACI
MHNINLENVELLITDSLQAVGLKEEEAKICAKNIAFADQQGTDTHGIMRLPIYIERLKNGLFNSKPNTQWVRENETSAVLDGDNGMGHYSAQLAMEKAIKKAEEKGIGITTLYNGNHIGAGACYTKMAAEKGMIGFLTTNAGPLMAPTGGTERLLGNNPICYAVPRREKDPIVLDIANSIVAGGKLQLASSKSEEIPLGWALDKEGKPTTDPDRGLEGVLLPIGGHKGYGLTLMMDILAGVLSGASYSKNIPHLDEEGKTGVGCTMIAFKIENFMELEHFYDRLDDFTSLIVDSKKAPGFERILLPGEIESETKDKRLQEGTQISDSLRQELVTMLDDLQLQTDKYGL